MTTRLTHCICLVFSLVLAGTAAALSLSGGDEPELLAPEQAFANTVEVDDTGKLGVQIDIADGYFLYKSKIRLQSDSAFISSPALPRGKVKQDEFFGEVETYRNKLNFNAEITNRTSEAAIPITLVTQGCADIGICYPPYSQEFIVNVPASSNTIAIGNGNRLNPLIKPASPNIAMADPVPAQTINTLSALRRTDQNNALQSNVLQSDTFNANTNSPLKSLRLNSNADEILDPEVAFTVSTGAASNGKIPISWNIADGYFLYGPKFKFEVVQPAGLAVADATLSKGKLKNDEFFGEIEVHRNQVDAVVALNNRSDLKNLKLKVGYQGCADAGICYPPQYKELDIAIIPAVASAATTDGSINTVIKTANNNSSNIPVAEQDRLAASLGSGKTITTILTFFGLGILLTFTPCVLPMIPILSSIIVDNGEGEKIGTAKAFTLSLIYVLAMALTYTVAGVIIGLTGENIQATLQHPFVLGAFALLFVVLAASMFGLFELQMPAFVQNRLTNVSNKQKSGSVAGVATMGFLSALIVGPCVTAPLVGALIYIGQTGDAVLGGAALFALSMGMGLPLLIIGTSFGKYLPTAGPWMDKIKAIFGVMLLGLAIWMLDRVAPGWAIMLMSALLLIVVGMFVGAFDSNTTTGWQRVVKGFGYTSVVYGTLLIIGVATGTGTLTKPLQGLARTSGSTGSDIVTANQHVAFNQIKGISQLQTALDAAKTQNKAVILDFYADWCVSCKEMEAFTFTNETVAKQMLQAVLLQADVTANDKEDKALLRKFGIFGPPAIIFYDPTGAEINGARVVGFMNADKFSSHLERIL